MLELTTFLGLAAVVTIIISVALFLYWIFSNGGAEKQNSKLKAMVAVAVTAVWIAATLADIMVTGYTVSPLIHALMGGIVGYFFADEGIQFNFGGS